MDQGGVFMSSLKGVFSKKKTFFLILIESVKSNFRLKMIRPPSALLDHPSAILVNKGALLDKGRSLFQE